MTHLEAMHNLDNRYKPVNPMSEVRMGTGGIGPFLEEPLKPESDGTRTVRTRGSNGTVVTRTERTRTGYLESLWHHSGELTLAQSGRHATLAALWQCLDSAWILPGLCLDSGWTFFKIENLKHLCLDSAWTLSGLSL